MNKDTADALIVNEADVITLDYQFRFSANGPDLITGKAMALFLEKDDL